MFNLFLFFLICHFTKHQAKLRLYSDNVKISLYQCYIYFWSFDYLLLDCFFPLFSIFPPISLLHLLILSIFSALYLYSPDSFSSYLLLFYRFIFFFLFLSYLTFLVFYLTHFFLHDDVLLVLKHSMVVQIGIVSMFWMPWKKDWNDS